MKYHVLVAGHHYEVEVRPHEGGLSVTVDGTTHQVDVATLQDGRAYGLLVDDRSLDVGVEERSASLELLVAGRRYSTEVFGEREWLSRSIQPVPEGGERLVRAAMTGILRDLLVTPGQAVTKGEVLFILEAMKMENEVRAEVDGVVKAVHGQPGATLEKGVVVVEIGD